MKTITSISAALVLALGASGIAQADDASETLYRYRPAPKGVTIWSDGQGGPISQFQSALRDKLSAAGVPASELPVADGSYGPKTSSALRRLFTLPGFSDMAPSVGSEPRISAALWNRLLPGRPLPSVAQRVDSLVLTYEATPFDGEAQWNFCQSRPSSKRRSEHPCRSNDPNSYLTWGPRGATAGGGREIQGVLVALENAAPTQLTMAFADEAPAVRRMLRLGERRKGAVDLSTEVYLCGIWMDPARADRWSQGFAKLGTSPEARSAYANLYRSAGFDGAKMLGFVNLYQKLGLTPTEVDLAFFVDRATHTGGVFAPGTSANSNEAVAVVAAKVRADVGDPWQAKPWTVRRSLSKALATVNQHADRLGRDVVMFVDGVGEAALTAEERDSWIARGPRRASDVGLSDERAAGPINVSNDKFDTIIQPAAALTAQERAACPLWVLNWTNPNTGLRVPAIK